MDKESYLGIYRGVVEDTNDPLNLGRCKIRVPAVHGSLSKSDIPLLPWARYISPLPTGLNKGMFITPEVSDIVWVLFEGGEKDYPVYIGSTYGIVSGENEAPLDGLNQNDVEILYRSKNVNNKYSTIKKTDEYFELRYDNSFMRINFKNNNIDIHSEGDINISSKGSIYVEGLQIHLNRGEE